MSAEAVGYVYRHSPYLGARFQLHHAIADSANDQNDFLVWLGVKKLATKTRLTPRSVVSGLAQLTRDEFLELVDGQHGQSRGATYRMLFPDVPVVYDSLEGRSTSAKRSLVKSTTSEIDDTNRCNPPRPLVQSTVSSPSYELKELKEPKRARSAPRDELFEALCKVDGIDWNNATKSELGRIRSVHKNLREVNATVKQVQAHIEAMKTAGLPPRMITAKSIESHWSEYAGNAKAKPVSCPECGSSPHAPDCNLKGKL